MRVSAGGFGDFSALFVPFYFHTPENCARTRSQATWLRASRESLAYCFPFGFQNELVELVVGSRFFG
jgi:hypothetical protein